MDFLANRVFAQTDFGLRTSDFGLGTCNRYFILNRMQARTSILSVTPMRVCQKKKDQKRNQVEKKRRNKRKIATCEVNCPVEERNDERVTTSEQREGENRQSRGRSFMAEAKKNTSLVFGVAALLE